jgi:hypothetical protein
VSTRLDAVSLESPWTVSERSLVGDAPPATGGRAPSGGGAPVMGMPHGFVTNVGGFNAATQALKASGAFLTEQLGSTAR